MPAMRRLLPTFVPLSVVVLAGCGGGNSSTTSGPASVAATTAAPSAAATRWTGAWRTTFGAMRLTAREGDTVTGTYAYCGGTLTGTVTGRVFTGNWTESPSASGCEKRGADAPTTGGFAFTLGADGGSFGGTWNYANGAKDTHGDAWRGVRDGVGA
jgi:hypothetical protein